MGVSNYSFLNFHLYFLHGFIDWIWWLVWVTSALIDWIPLSPFHIWLQWMISIAYINALRYFLIKKHLVDNDGIMSSKLLLYLSKHVKNLSKAKGPSILWCALPHWDGYTVVFWNCQYLLHDLVGFNTLPCYCQASIYEED